MLVAPRPVASTPERTRCNEHVSNHQSEVIRERWELTDLDLDEYAAWLNRSVPDPEPEDLAYSGSRLRGQRRRPVSAGLEGVVHLPQEGFLSVLSLLALTDAVRTGTTPR